MRTHSHRPVKERSRERCWSHCVAPGRCPSEVAHGNVERADTCACGMVRQSEHNAGRSVYGGWEFLNVEE